MLNGLSNKIYVDQYLHVMLNVETDHSKCCTEYKVALLHSTTCNINNVSESVLW